MTRFISSIGLALLLSVALVLPASAGDHRAIFKAAADFGVQVRHLRPSVPTLEDVFAKAIGEE